MHFFFFHPVIKHIEDNVINHELISVREPQHNTNEGSGFLDDAIRADDFPLIHTEESIAAGSPEDLL